MCIDLGSTSDKLWLNDCPSEEGLAALTFNFVLSSLYAFDAFRPGFRCCSGVSRPDQFDVHAKQTAASAAVNYPLYTAQTLKPAFRP